MIKDIFSQILFLLDVVWLVWAASPHDRKQEGEMHGIFEEVVKQVTGGNDGKGGLKVRSNLNAKAQKPERAKWLYSSGWLPNYSHFQHKY